MDQKSRIRILCVDDEQAVLDGLSLNLHRRYEVVTATSGAAGLEILQRDPSIAVVTSDMRMPGMDGAAFLSRARAVLPNAVRVLLTGQADMSSAITAVNEGQIFRFLTKPCQPNVLVATVDAAAEQHRLINAERVLLEQTLHGSVKALTDLLAIVHPASFGRAGRAKQRVSTMADHLGIQENRWELEVSAMLSQIGCIMLPQEVVDKLYQGLVLSEREHEMVERIPQAAEKIVAGIPRMEGVRAILRYQDRRFSGVGYSKDEPHREQLPLGSRLLKIALDYDALEARGIPQEVAFDTLRGREGWYDPSLLDAFAKSHGNAGKNLDVREIKLAALSPGMVLAEDIRTQAGGLLVARGHEITEGLIERIRNFGSAQGVCEPIRVILAKSVRAQSEPLVAVS
ncbi:MAG: response regulator [Acidobacteria bacterium]|nr:response regulator [Acidobacteriota bacterium]